MPPTLVNSYKAEDATADMAAISITPNFTPAVGELIVVKAAASDAGQAFSSNPVASGFTVGTWTQRLNVGTSGSSCRCAIWTATVTASAAGTITLTPSGGTREHSMVVERWSGWQLAASPATVSFVADASSPFTGVCTTAQADSVISWLAADWNGLAAAGATLADSPSQEQTATYIGGIYTTFWCTQAAPSAGGNTVGISSHTGAPSFTLAGIEIESSGGAPTTVPAPPAYGSGQAPAPSIPAQPFPPAAQGSGAASTPVAQAGTGWLYAGSDSAVAGSWDNLPGAVGSGTGDSATWTDSGTGTSGTLELSAFAAQDAVPAGATVDLVKIRVRHGETPAAQIASVTAQAYLGTTPYGSPQALTKSETLHEDEITVGGLTRADLADLRVRVTATKTADAPSAPTNVTSITKDAGATVSFRAPASEGSGSITHYVITPYIGGTAQAATTIAVASLGSLTGSDGNSYLQGDVTGLTNGTAYTFRVQARNSYGDSPESAASGANTPYSGLVFGDDFNGPASGDIDPEWWVYTRCGYLNQNEVQYYLPSQVRLDGAGSLLLVAEHTSYTGPGYPSGGGGSVTQPWRSGAVQSNSRLYHPAAGNTMTFEVRQQVMADAGSGFWPGLFWLEGQDYLQAWKTDPYQAGWDSTGKAEIDVAEWYQSGSPDSYGNVSWAGGNETHNNSASGLSSSQHIYQALWKPGVSVIFKRDGSTTFTASSQVPASGAEFFLMLYLQMLGGGPTTTEQCAIDYVRVYDQNLG